jgi:hypothetical protein
MRTSFHYQPEAQHPNSSAIHKPPADYPIFLWKSGRVADHTAMTEVGPQAVFREHSLDLPIGLSHRLRDGSVVSSPPLHE